MSKKLKLISLVLSVAVMISLLGGCVVPAQNSNQPSDLSSTTDEKLAFPLKEQITLRYFATFGATGTGLNNNGETELFKELERRTNIKFEHINAPTADEGQTLNLMLAARDVPDIIEDNFGKYPGGINKAKAEGIIIALNDYLEEYAPNFNKLLKEYPEDIGKEISTVNGEYLNLPYVNTDLQVLTIRGLSVRGDWLDELGMDAPVTIDDWYKMLTAFKEQKGAERPLALKLEIQSGFLGCISGAYGIFTRNKAPFYLDGDTIKFGPYEAVYKDYLQTLHKWYSEGLISKDSPMSTVAQQEADFVNGKSGAIEVSAVANTRLSLQGKELKPTFQMRPVPYPVLKEGDKNLFLYTGKISSLSGKCLCISSTNKHVKESVMFLDYGYTPEGSVLYSFGIEGESYQKNADGKLEFTDKVVNDPDDRPYTEVLMKYARGSSWGSYTLHPDFGAAMSLSEEQRESNRAWNIHAEDYIKNKNSAKNKMTDDQNAQYTDIITPIRTYIAEMFLKFVSGQEPLSNFDQYIQKLKDMRIEEAILLRQLGYYQYLQ